MGYERYPRGTSQGDDYGRGAPRDYGSGRDEGQRYGRYAQQPQGGRDDDRGREHYERHDHDRGQPDGRHAPEQGRYAPARPSGYGHVDRSRYGADAGRDDRQEYHGSYGSGSRRFEDFGRTRHADDDDYRGQQGRQQQGHGRQPQGYDYDDRGFFARAGDEVRSWFGDEEAERRRNFDSRLDERAYDDRDRDYHSWRRGQIESLDRDYDEYRREHQSKFHTEFGSWRTGRQTQRDALQAVVEHMDVVGADGEHVGTVDKVRGDRILLTRTDADAGGRHHSIPSSWLQTVDGKVTLRQSAAEAKAAWRDEERNQALFGDDDRSRRRDGASSQSGTSEQGGATSASSASGGTDGKASSRSFSGSY